MYHSVILGIIVLISPILSLPLPSDQFANADPDFASKPTEQVKGNDKNILEWKPIGTEGQIISRETNEEITQETKEDKHKGNLLTEKVETETSKDLIGQETFYPSGGIWWGFRPWGGWGHWGWGGYRPGWYNPHWGGFRPGWYNPHWGGNWGGGWGSGHWRGKK